MIRLPSFRYVAPTTVAEASTILRGGGADTMLLAGGTDLLPNMKRRQQQPKTLIGMRRLALHDSEVHDGWQVLGSGIRLEDLVGNRAIQAELPALWRAAAQVATPPIRNQATLGGNLCLDTRCNYYNQSAEWREAIQFCMKAPASTGGVYRAGPPLNDTSICWVAPSSPRCWAISSTDTAPALIALGAQVELESHSSRRIPLEQLYRSDGIAYLAKQPDEIVTRVFVPVTGLRSTYWKLRRRGSFDFPVASVALALRLKASVVESARLVLGAVASAPVLCEDAAATLVGKALDDNVIFHCADVATRFAKPLDNSDFALSWRKQAVKALITGALRELRGDDPATLGVLARHARRAIPLSVVS